MNLTFVNEYSNSNSDYGWMKLVKVIYKSLLKLLPVTYIAVEFCWFKKLIITASNYKYIPTMDEGNFSKLFALIYLDCFQLFQNGRHCRKILKFF